VGIRGFFKEIEEENDRITIRSYTGPGMMGLALFFVGLIVAPIWLGFAYIESGSGQEVPTMAGLGWLAASVFGVVLRLAGPKMRVDFRSKEVINKALVYPFSEIVFVALTERIQVVRSQHATNRFPMFDVTLGVGSADPDIVNEILDDIRTTDVGDDFVAADSDLDEQAVGAFFIQTELEPVRLFQSGSYPTLFRTSHRLAKTAGVPLLNLTGSSFSVASGSDLNMSFGQMLAENAAESSGFDDNGFDDNDFGDSAASVETETTPEGLEISWPYKLWLALLGTLVIGLGAAGLLLMLGMDMFGVVAAAIFAVITLLIAARIAALSGTYRIVVDGEAIRYKRPIGAEKSMALGDLIDVYVRPNVSGGMSALMLLSDTDVILVRGALPELKGVDVAIRRHLAHSAKSPSQ
jgi:hypothetical protein